MSTPLSITETTTVVLALIKTTWKLASSLSRFNQDTNAVDNTIRSLVWEVKSLGNVCDLIFSEIEGIAFTSPTELQYSHDLDGRIWSSLESQTESTSKTLQELESFTQSLSEEECTFFGQRQRKLDQSRDRIADIRVKVRRHTDYLHLIELLIKT